MIPFSFKKKNIIIFSAQSWGEMHLSKHHYAIALANLGNEVYFVNPPTSTFQEITIESHQNFKNLYIINSGYRYIEKFRFHFNFGFRVLTKYNVYKIIKKINKRIDIVWNFDFLGYCHYSLFKNAIKIAHPVDFTKKKYLPLIKGADLIFSVANEILEEFNKFNIPSYFINHGISDDFINNFDSPQEINTTKLKVGYVGNLLRLDIDYDIILSLIHNNPEVEFVFIGNYTPSNIGGSLTMNAELFINALKERENVTLKGVLKNVELPCEMNKLDIFLISYNKEKDSCRGTNYHKVMEYLSTGKVVISNHITTYSGNNLIQMPEKYESNKSIINIFNEIKSNIKLYNNKENQIKRIAFAKENTYVKQIERIENIINTLKNGQL